MLASSPSEEIDSLFVALGNTCLSGIPVLPALNSTSRRQHPGAAHSDAARPPACIDQAAAELAAAMRAHRQ